MQPILQKYDVLFVVDEVICGFGRTGNMFGAQTFDLQPDIITRREGAVGRLPADFREPRLRTRSTTMLLAQSDKLGIFGHGYTYSSHPVPAAVALETLKIYEERDIVAHVRRVAPRMQAGIRAHADHPLIGDARGHRPDRRRGARPRQGDESRASIRRPASPRIWSRRAQHHGVILRNMPGDIVAFCPPLIISESEIDEMLAGFAQALDDTSAHGPGKGARVAPAATSPIAPQR